MSKRLNHLLTRLEAKGEWLPFATEIREALAEEMAEAVRLLESMAKLAPQYRNHPFNCNVIGTMIVDDCRAAARFVAEHGKKEA